MQNKLVNLNRKLNQEISDKNYGTEYVDMVLEYIFLIFMARYLNPKEIKRIAKEAEGKTVRKIDKLMFMSIRKSSNPVALIDLHQASYLRLMKAEAKQYNKRHSNEQN